MYRNLFALAFVPLSIAGLAISLVLQAANPNIILMVVLEPALLMIFIMTASIHLCIGDLDHSLPDLVLLPAPNLKLHGEVATLQ